MLPFPPSVSIERIETRAVLKQLSETRAKLAELKGVSQTIPNERILIDTLSLQEAKDSSEIENIITTHDEIYRSGQQLQSFSSAAAKEVHRYADALKLGFEEVRKDGFISLKLILKVQEAIEGNNAGLRKVPGTVLKNDLTGEVVYQPPQNYNEIIKLMSDLEKFINSEPDSGDMDPLVKMALIHHQFESIHPFYDGNGRTGRIINILFLIKENLLSIPVLYLSRYLIQHRAEYYELLQSTRETGDWESWVLYMLTAVEQTSIQTITLIHSIKQLMQSMKKRIREENPKLYTQDLLNNLFRHPYTKITLVQQDLKVSRLTATRYLEALCEMGILNKLKIGRNNYYVNHELFGMLRDLK